MKLIVISLIILALGLSGLAAWWWSVAELMRGFAPLAMLAIGAISVVAGIQKLPAVTVAGGAQDSGSGDALASNQKAIGSFFLKEDWWAVWLGLTFTVFALATFATSTDVLQALAVHPGSLKWQSLPELFAHFGEHVHLYAIQFCVWAFFLGVACRVMGIEFWTFVRGFGVLYGLSIAVFSVSGWHGAAQFNLEPPLVALVVGLVLANTVRIPPWVSAALRVEFFVKLGIVFLGATFPITLVLTAGPVAIGQATVISLIGCLTIYFTATRWFGLDRRLAAVISVGGSVCGVSASMAIAAAVGATKDHIYASVTLVVGWALVMILFLPFVSQALGLHPGVAGAWIGTSEFADAAGFAAAASYGKMAGNEEAALKSFTLMKVIGRDLWIGIWAMVWALVATTVWDRESKEGEAQKHGASKVDPGEIWRRFPKFVIGFFAASIIVTLATSGYSEQEIVKTVKPALLDPINAMRSWAFIFCFLAIGMTTRFRDLHAVNWPTFSAFSIGVAVNVVAGFILSVYIFGEYWARM
ncbi:putative sulfate exporter family transporter [Magnetovibrio sp. PR-2]|uniref:putative sulfate exporter family transporter n=1 Tax=Magnetovibrio sp. PR-2 TaxID=3120356 RepID=UPI002FCE5592